METFLLILATVSTLGLLLAMYRFNLSLAKHRPIEAKLSLDRQPFYLMNTVGKWLALTGGVATGSLLIALIFMGHDSPEWIIIIGVLGLITLIIASFILGFIFIKNCLTRKLKMKPILLTMARQLINKVKTFNGFKIASWIAGIAVLIVFLPFFIELISDLIFVGGFVLIARFGLLDNVGDQEDDWDFDFSASYHSHDNDEYYYHP